MNTLGFIVIFMAISYFPLFPDQQLTRDSLIATSNFENYVILFTYSCCAILIAETLLDVLVNVTSTDIRHSSTTILISRFILLSAVILTIMSTNSIRQTDSYIDAIQDACHIRHSMIMWLIVVSSSAVVNERKSEIKIWRFNSRSPVSIVTIIILCQVTLFYIQYHNTYNIIHADRPIKNILSALVISMTYNYGFVKLLASRSDTPINMTSYGDLYNKTIYQLFIVMEIVRYVLIVIINMKSFSHTIEYETINLLYLIVDLIIIIILIAVPDRYAKYNSRPITE